MSAPVFFATAAEFRAWLARHAETATELVVGFHKVGTDQPSMTWPESVDEALCVGWIDGVRKRIDDRRYQIRFSPRKPTSIWSAINIERVRVLSEAGRMKRAGLAAFERRREHKSRIYSFEQKDAEVALAPEDARRFRRHARAWSYFRQQPAGYRKQMIWRILSAKLPATRERRLTILIEAC